MPRAGLTSDDVVAAAAELADEVGFRELTMGLLAQRLGIRSPSLYKHVTDLADLRHRVAALAMAEAGEAIRDALQGRSGRDALNGLLTAFLAYVTTHPGRYAATVGEGFTGPDDPLLAATTRVIDSISAALRGYGISDTDMVHAIRTVRCTIHGFATLAEEGGFYWSGEPGDTFGYMIGFIDRGLRAEVPTAG
jgi:AcrR family transcriptional regulator